jgi:pyruvate/2-oxoglutarate/acetoin dehydrogenase E1 component
MQAVATSFIINRVGWKSVKPAKHAARVNYVAGGTLNKPLVARTLVCWTSSKFEHHPARTEPWIGSEHTYPIRRGNLK